MDIFNVPGHLLGLDYITKNQRLTFGVARSHGSKVQKFNFWANFECMSACQNLPMGFYCLNESPPYALLKTIRVTMGYCWHFLLQSNKVPIFKKICCFKKSIMADSLT